MTGVLTCALPIYLDHLAEDGEQVLARVKERALQGSRSALARAAKEYGMVRTRKFFNGLSASGGDRTPYAADHAHR